MNLATTWQWLTTSPLTAITLTVGVYWACDKLWRRTGRHPLLTPILTASALIGVLLLLTGWDYAAYADGTTMITFLLGPATVALGLPLHRQAAKVLEGAPMVLGAVLFGAVFSVLSGYWLATLLGATHELALTMAPKSATTPIAMALVQQLGERGGPGMIEVERDGQRLALELEKILARKVRPAGVKYASIFGIDPGDPVYYIRRLCSADGEPVSLEEMIAGDNEREVRLQLPTGVTSPVATVKVKIQVRKINQPWTISH